MSCPICNSNKLYSGTSCSDDIKRTSTFTCYNCDAFFTETEITKNHKIKIIYIIHWKNIKKIRKMNCPKCNSYFYVASPYVDCASGYGTSSNGDPNQVIKSGHSTTQICTKCNVWFTISQDFENNVLIKEKIEWEIRKEPLIPASGSDNFWKNWKNDEKVKARKEKIK